MARSFSSSSSSSTTSRSVSKAFWIGLACGICLTLTLQSIASGFGWTTSNDYYAMLSNSQDLFQYYYDSQNASSLSSQETTATAIATARKERLDPMNMPIQLLRPPEARDKQKTTQHHQAAHQHDDVMMIANQTQQPAAAAAAAEKMMIGKQTATADQDASGMISIRDFERQEGVVIVTKIHGPENWKQYRQSMCLLNAAYNDRVHYDMVLFTTLPIPQENVDELRSMVAPANFFLVVDRQTLEEQLQDLTPQQAEVLLQRCNRTSLDQLEWELRCNEPNSHTAAIQYLWQAEFRSKHLWTQPILQPYQTMLWFDSDSMPMKRWEQDPIATFRKNDLVVLFANFPSGKSRGQVFTERIYQTYNQTLCGIDMILNVTTGGKHLRPHFHPTYPCPSKNQVNYNQIHGFFHITNLEFYRSKLGLKWANTLIGDTKFSRKFDDQIAVTVPGAVLAPEKSWDMRSNGMNLSIMHNGRLDGKGKSPYGWYKDYWKNQAETLFPQAWQKCQGLVVNGGR